MNDKKTKTILLIISLLVLTIGLTYAYFSASVQGTGNANAEASATTATLGEVEFNGENTFDTTNIWRNIYPGFIGVQSFTIAPYKDGSGVYEIDLEANVPSAFGSDIKITLYKTSDATNNNIESEEGSLTITNNQYVKQDTLTITGTLTKVYEGRLTDTDEEILEQVEFLIENDEFTTPDTTPDDYYTYYVVYEYLDNENQNNQQGLDFDAKITVKYVIERNPTAADTLASLQILNPSLTLTQSTASNPDFSELSPSTPPTLNRLTGISVTPSNYITYGDDVTYNSTTGIYTLTNPITCQWSSCYQSLQDMYITPSGMAIGESTNIPVTESNPNVYNAVVQVTSATSNSVDVIYYTDDKLNVIKTGSWNAQPSGLYSLKDDYGDSYYFRGAVTNNYVKFAGFYWRIIRINGNGSIRMIYSGNASVIDGLSNKLEVLANEYNDKNTRYKEISETNFNSTTDDNAYVGYMYGEIGADNYADAHDNIHDSNAKTRLDLWYENNILNTNNEQYISDSLFCNDRSIANQNVTNYYNNDPSKIITYTNEGYGDNYTIYGFNERINEQDKMELGNKMTFKCPQKNDAFTVSDILRGNVALTYPIGLITADEEDIAGFGENEQSTYYLHSRNNTFIMTMTPDSYMYNSSQDYNAFSMATLATGMEGGHGIIRPVINLKPGSITSGNGTTENPFTVE